MSTTESALAAHPVRERRLHRMSWLFVLLQQLRQFIVPLAALLLFGRGDRNELWPLIGVGVLVVISVWRYFTYRYAVEDDRLVIRSGLLERSARIIPFGRIHNVAVQQSMLHRVFGVAEVRLESAGGKRPEAEMRVLSLDDALQLESLVRQRGSTTAATGTDIASAPPPDRLLHLSTAEVVRYGLISNRGLVVVAAAFAGLMQFGPRNAGPRLMERLASDVGGRITGYGGARGFETLDYVLVFGALAVLAIAALRLLSVVLALLQFHGFELTAHGRRLTIERGLAARWRTSLSRRRIQAWTLREGLLHRLFRRRSLHVDIATGNDPGDAQRQLRELAPVATAAACDALIEQLLPQAGWSMLDWHPVPRSAWWRLVLADAALATVAAGALALRFGGIGLLALLWIPFAAFLARQRIAREAYVVDARVAAIRGGWWSRTWRFAEIDKLQAVQLVRGPLDRRCGTASLLLDTAGAGAMSTPIRLRFLPYGEAQALQSKVAAMLARRPLRW